MQTYQCNHCHVNFPSIFDVFIHIFCQHMHQDIALTPHEGRIQLKSTTRYTLKGVLCLN